MSADHPEFTAWQSQHNNLCCSKSDGAEVMNGVTSSPDARYCFKVLQEFALARSNNLRRILVSPLSLRSCYVSRTDIPY